MDTTLQAESVSITIPDSNEIGALKEQLLPEKKQFSYKLYFTYISFKLYVVFIIANCVTLIVEAINGDAKNNVNALMLFLGNILLSLIDWFCYVHMERCIMTIDTCCHLMFTLVVELVLIAKVIMFVMWGCLVVLDDYVVEMFSDKKYTYFNIMCAINFAYNYLITFVLMLKLAYIGSCIKRHRATFN
jgi:hypothetical protein